MEFLDTIPEKFRASIPTKLTSVVEAGQTAEAPTPAGDVLESTTQRLTAHKVRKTQKTRDPVGAPILTGQTYDEILNIASTFEEKLVPQGSGYTGVAEVTPLSDKWAVARTPAIGNLQNQLRSLHYKFPTQERIRLPDKLLSAKAVFSMGAGASWGGGQGSRWSFSRGCEASISGDLILNIEQGFEGSVPATIHVFYESLDNASFAIYSRTGAKDWPAIKLLSHTVILMGADVRKENSLSASDDSSAMSGSVSVKTILNTVNIPPTIHGKISIGVEHIMAKSNVAVPSGPQPVKINGEEVGSAYFDTLPSLTGEINPTTLDATSKSKFPTGIYILSSDVTPYKWGMAKVTVVTVNITEDYV